MQVHLVEGSSRVLSPMSEHASKKAQKFLEGMGVIVHLNTMVKSYDGNTVVTADGKSFHTATFIWAAGVTGAPVQWNRCRCPRGKTKSGTGSTPTAG